MAVAAVTGALLSTRGLSRRFGGLQAVNAVDFDLGQGEVRALIGPNGAGKTTFVSMLVGRLPASAGSIRFAGEDVTRLPPHQRVRRGMAYTFQITSVFSRLPVAENVALAARRTCGGNALRVAGEVARRLVQVGLAGREDQLAGELSYGHHRLLEIAMGLAQSPRLLILDEPTQGLSDAEIAGFQDLVRSLVPETTVLLIEHNMRVVMELADRITVLASGEVLAEGTPAEVRADRRVQTAYLGAA